MKIPSLLLAASLAANAALIAAFAFRPSLAPPAFRNFFARGSDSATGAAGSSTKGRAAKRDASKNTGAAATLWSTLQTDDLPRLVAQLRAAGFPIYAIRAIVLANLRPQYDSRLRELMQPDPDAPFWKSTASFGTDPKRMAEYRRLTQEYRKTLHDLLGNFSERDDGDITSGQRRRYGDLPGAKIESVTQIEQDYTEMTAQVRAAMNDIILPEDREKLALLEKEKKTDLGGILTPEELEGYDMRTSMVTMRLRASLGLFHATEDEFRTIYKIQTASSDLIYPAGPAAAPAEGQQRVAAQQQVSDQIKAALGEQRYAEFVRSGDRDYQQLTQLEQRENLPAGTAVQVYNLRDGVSQESNRIFKDTTLTVDQKRAALQSLAQSTRAQLVSTLGSTAAETYLKTANSWLGSIERGGAVTFTPAVTGVSTRTQLLPPARPSGAANGAIPAKP